MTNDHRRNTKSDARNGPPKKIKLAKRPTNDGNPMLLPNWSKASKIPRTLGTATPKAIGEHRILANARTFFIKPSLV